MWLCPASHMGLHWTLFNMVMLINVQCKRLLGVCPYGGRRFELHCQYMEAVAKSGRLDGLQQKPVTLPPPVCSRHRKPALQLVVKQNYIFIWGCSAEDIVGVFIDVANWNVPLLICNLYCELNHKFYPVSSSRLIPLTIQMCFAFTWFAILRKSK